MMHFLYIYAYKPVFPNMRGGGAVSHYEVDKKVVIPNDVYFVCKVYKKRSSIFSINSNGNARFLNIYKEGVEKKRLGTTGIH